MCNIYISSLRVADVSSFSGPSSSRSGSLGEVNGLGENGLGEVNGLGENGLGENCLGEVNGLGENGPGELTGLGRGDAFE